MKGKEIEDLVKGDVIYIYFGRYVHKAKVISNAPKEKKMFLNVILSPGFLGTSLKEVFSYSSYNLVDYKVMNQL